MRRVKQAALWVGRLASEAASARKLIDRLNQTILAKAFRGELVPQDLNNEPASLLIERLRAEQPIKSNTRGLKVRVRQSRKAR